MIGTYFFQGPSYRWNIKISQIPCEDITSFSSYSNCGKTNPSGLNSGFQFNAFKNTTETIEIEAIQKVNVCKKMNLHIFIRNF